MQNQEEKSWLTVLLDVFHLSLQIHFAALTPLSAWEDWPLLIAYMAHFLLIPMGLVNGRHRKKMEKDPEVLPSWLTVCWARACQQLLLVGSLPTATARSGFQGLTPWSPREVSSCNFLLVLAPGYLLVSFKSAQAFVDSTFIKISLISAFEFAMSFIPGLCFKTSYETIKLHSL